MKISSLQGISVASAVAAVLMSASGVAAAATPGFYIATDLAMDSADFSSGQFVGFVAALEDSDEADFNIDESSLDKRNVGFSLAVGYQITPNIAVEAAYLDLGKVTFGAAGTVDGGEGASDLGIDIGFKSKGPSVAVIGSWPINEMFSVDGRLGVYQGKTKADLSVVVDGEEVSGPLAADKKTAMLVGVGATWALSDKVGVRLGYTRIKDAVADQDVDRFALGLRFSF